MKQIRSILLLVLFLSFLGIANAQNTAGEQDLIERIIENIAEQEEDNPDYTNLLEEITKLIQHPLNINAANSYELEKLYFLNQNQIEQLIKYREENGSILSIYEIQLIKGFSAELVKNIAPLISTKEIQKPISLKKTQHQLLIRSEHNFQKEAGYNKSSENSKYLGNPWKYYSRYQMQSPKSGLDFGFTAENDKGEPFFKDQNSNGFDFYSAHVQKKSNGLLKQINLGDYQIKFGQGVSLWSGMGGKKSSFTTQNARKYQGIRSYKSTDENRFFRGASIIISPLKGINIAAFSSYKKIDASSGADTISSFTSSIVNTGLHRNRNELDKKDILKEKLFGGYFSWNLKNTQFGAAFIQYSYSPEIKIAEKAYSQYNFTGKNNYNLSINYQTQINNIHLFGEAARSKSGGIGILQGANIQIHPQFNLETIYRKYDKDFHAHYSNSFSEQSRSQNEEGIYIGINFHPFSKWSIKAYYDQFEFPWLRYSSNSPTDGHEYFAQIEYTNSDKLSIYFRYKQENKADNINADFINIPVEYEKTQYRLHLSTKPATNWEIRNRIEFTKYKQADRNENGFLIYQDLIYRFSQFPLNISLRYALFDTDSYDTRIYAYENDILYAYSVPAYYNKGSRFYLNLNYKISNKITLYARYALTKYSNKESIGSGTSLIDGDTKSDVKLQLKFRF
ncbi:helix-hairpin-helix domain-containing protein [Marinifilum sp. D714]|uniref:helix-hairpin-helix domain-containing protein n=1 Tax=Marinifilum sp. D714 TaxID=2937523 RepID=UPI0027C13F4B|nr:helix-hairpin-helix domain-containing protein [Marinifilum sp. D714]MDQ2180574.1 helix-hairpin-helix domain-containing protein [Marinifilum sp. D714]